MGSLAVGGAAAIGTGAFSDVSANRTVSVKVAPDSDAYLTLKTDGNENAAYADGSSAQMTVDLDGSDSQRGAGLIKTPLPAFSTFLASRIRGRTKHSCLFPLVLFLAKGHSTYPTMESISIRK
jgi:hypothetical protein